MTLHTGDSHQLLPSFLAELVEQDRNVDFVMIDGDHSPSGIRQDIENLLNSTALGHTVILIHDLANERVREGADSVRFGAWPKVAHVELDWIPGQLFAEAPLRNELWYGLGLVIVDSTRLAYLNGSVYEQRYHPAAALLAQIRQLVKAREGRQMAPEASLELEALKDRVQALEQELNTAYRRVARTAAVEEELALAGQRIERADRVMHDLMSSVSWRVTSPLRAVKRSRPSNLGD